MLEVYDKDFKKISILQNAYSIKENKKINSIDTLEFSLPYFDSKNKYCKPYNYVRYQGGQLYRIVNVALDKSEEGSYIYECEHVISTLLDITLNGYTIIGNRGVYTSEVINFILNYPKTKGLKVNWRLRECDFRREFEYKFENENLLGALFSIPRPFTDNYIWNYNTDVYPWELSLKRIDESINPQLYIWNKKNLLNLTKQSDTREICTRLYPLGYGEGINQLNIKEVNNNIPYIQSPQEYINEYGIIERVWIDRRYEDAESLLEAAKSMLNQLQEPSQEYTIGFKQVGKSYFDIAEVGKVSKIIDTDTKEEFKTYITGINIDYDDIEQTTITIANRANSIADTIADLADRQRIEMTYSQGATQMYAQSTQINADKNNGAVIDFFVPEDMRIINKVLLNIKQSKFRAYSKATEGGGGVSTTTSNGGGTSTTTSNGGGISTTTSDGGGITTTTSDGGGINTTTSDGGGIATTTSNGGATTSGSSSINTTDNADVPIQIDNVVMYSDATYLIPTSLALEGTEFAHVHTGQSHGHNLIIEGHSHEMAHTHYIDGHTHQINLPEHTHQINLPEHTHQINLPKHTHQIDLPEHTHQIKIEPHSHTIELPDHEHTIKAGIYFFGNPTSFQILINGKLKETVLSNECEIDITNYLLNDDKKIARGQWYTIEIKPNDLAYINTTLFVQGFVQSRGDMTV